jgi:hypothetical protein
MLLIDTLLLSLCRLSKTNFYINVRIGMCIGYWWESQKERDHREDQGVGGWTILEWILER